MKKVFKYLLSFFLLLSFLSPVFVMAADADPVPTDSDTETDTVEKTVVGVDQFCNGTTLVCPTGQVCEGGRCINSLKSTGAGAEVQFEDYGLGDMGKKLGYTTTGVEKNTLLEKIGAAIRIALGLIGTVVLVMMVYSGFTWMTARGNSDQVKKAKESMTHLFIGLVLLLSAYALSSFVIEAVSKFISS